MKNNKLQIILSLFLIALFPLTTTLTFQATGYKNDNLIPNIVQTGTANYLEDFTTETFKDPSTSAFGWGSSTVTNRRNFSLSLLDYYPTIDPATGLAVQGRKAYVTCLNVTDFETDFRILNINDPKDIKLTDLYGGWSGSMTVEVEGDYAYVGKIPALTPINYLISYDVQDPFSINYVHSILIDGQVTDIDPEGDFVYYAAYGSSSNGSFNILYNEDPSNPELIPSNWNTNLTLGIDVEGGIAYVAASTDGLYTLNVSDKYNPTEVGHIALAGNATDVIADGNFVYLAAGNAGIYVIDVSDPSNPILRGQCNTPGYARRIVLQGRTLFVADGNGGVQILDVYDPNNPTIVTQLNALPYTWDVDLYGDVLVIATDNGIYTYRIGYITDFESYYINTYDDHEVWDVKVIGDIAYIAGGPDGLITLNVRDPNNPILLDSDVIGLSAFYRKLDVVNGFAYVADYGNAFRIYDVRDPTNIKQTDSTSLTYPADVAISGDIAWIADGIYGVYYYNISNPYVMGAMGFFDDSFENVTAVWVQGPHLYICEDKSSGSTVSVHVIDISDFSTLVTTYSRLRYDYNYDLCVDGDVLYLAGASSGNGAWTYNVTDPYSVLVGAGTFRDALGVWNFGPYMLTADNGDGAALINTTLINSITTLGICPNATSAIQITSSGDYTYVANKSSLVILRHFESPGDTYIAGTAIAQSIKVNEGPRKLIRSATLNINGIVPTGTNVEYFMSADGGLHWEAVTPSVAHDFVDIGYDLRWRAEITGPKDRSVHIYEITIDYEFNLAPTEPDLTDPGDTNFLGSVKLKWNESTDADGTIDHYDVEVSDSSSFTTILKNYTTTKTSKGIYPLKPGVYYFRVRAVDDGDAFSDWSTADIEVTFNLLGPMWLGIIGGGLLVLIALIVIISVVVRRKKKVKTR